MLAMHRRRRRRGCGARSVLGALDSTPTGRGMAGSRSAARGRSRGPRCLGEPVPGRGNRWLSSDRTICPRAAARSKRSPSARLSEVAQWSRPATWCRSTRGRLCHRCTTRTRSHPRDRVEQARTDPSPRPWPSGSTRRTVTDIGGLECVQAGSGNPQGHSDRTRTVPASPSTSIS